MLFINVFCYTFELFNNFLLQFWSSVENYCNNQKWLTGTVACCRSVSALQTSSPCVLSSVTSEDSDEQCELQTIQKELEELLVKKEELEKQDKSSELSNGTPLYGNTASS